MCKKAHARLYFYLFIHLDLLLNINSFQLSVFTADIQIVPSQNPHGEIGVPEIDVAASVDIADAGNGVAFTIKVGRSKQGAAIQGAAVGAEAYDIPATDVAGNGTVGCNQAAVSVVKNADAAETDTGFGDDSLVVLD